MAIKDNGGFGISKRPLSTDEHTEMCLTVNL